MRVSSMLLGATLAAATVLAPGEALAGTPTPLSSLTALPPAVPMRAPELPQAVPGVVVKSKDGVRDTRWHDLSTATGRGYCLVSSESGSRWTSSWGSSSHSAAEDLDLDRLVEKDGKATLERTRVHFDPLSGTLTALGRSQVELREVARTPAGIVVWAYRSGRHVVVLARNVQSGIEARTIASTDEGGVPFVSADGCPFAGARLDVAKPEAGTMAQLTGTLPAQGTGKEKVVPRFIIDASVSRVARDAEAMLAVRVRVRVRERD